MKDERFRAVVRHLRRLAGPEVGGLGDGELLRRWVADRDEAAFEVLVWRHGPMVRDLCRRLLPDPHDVEDSFQATFLALLKKGAAIRQGEAVGGWLYRVAYRVALAVRAAAAKRRTCDPQLLDSLAAAPGDDPVWRDLRPILDEEVNRLPERYRAPFVLCYFQGRTNEEAARELGRPVGTILSRLSRARERLRGRLARRGLTLTAAALAGVLSHRAAAAAVPPALVSTVMKAALRLAEGEGLAGVVASHVVALSEGALHAMMMTKVKLGVAVVLAAALLGGGGLWTSAISSAGPADKPPPNAPQAPAPGAAPRGEDRRPPQAGQPAKADPQAAEIKRLIDQLGSENFKDRETAVKRLEAIGRPALPALQKAATAAADAEVRRRSAALVETIERRVFGPIRTFEGHTDKATCVVFSPDGKRAASSADDKSVRLWDVATGKQIRQFDGHGSMTLSVAFTPDGKRLLSCSGWPPEANADYSIRLWDVESGKELRRIQGHTDVVWRVVFSPDGKRILSASRDNTMRLWDAATGKELRRFQGHTQWVRGCAFSPDGKRALSGSWDSTMRLWDIETGKELRQFLGHSAGINSVAFSPDGTLALSGGGQDGAPGDATLRLWDVKTGKQLHQFQGHTQRVWHVTFTPDGKRILSAAADGTIRLWDTKTGRELRIFRGHTGEVRSVAVSPDGRTFLSASHDRTIRLWPLEK